MIRRSAMPPIERLFSGLRSRKVARVPDASACCHPSREPGWPPRLRSSANRTVCSQPQRRSKHMRHRVVGHERVVDPVGGGHGRGAEGHVRDRRSPTTTTLLPTSSTISRRCATAGLFRFANHLAAWVEIEEGRIVDAGYSGGGLMGRDHGAPRQPPDDVRARPAPGHPPRPRDRRTRSRASCRPPAAARDSLRPVG